MKKTMKILFLVLVLTLAAVTLVACGHEHEYGEAMSYDGSHHWYAGVCEHEDAEDAAPIKDFATHTMGTRQITEQPTCGKAGKAVTACTVCGFERVELLPAEGEHTWEMEGDSYKPYRETTSGSKFIYERKKCTTCNAMSAAEKAYGADWSANDTQHFHAPSDASKGWAPLDPADHTFKTSYTHKKAALYLVETCEVCRYKRETLVPNGIAVTDTQSAQAALDAATADTFIYFFPALYETLYFRTTAATSTEYDYNEDWAGGSGKIYYREIEGLTLMAETGAIFRGFITESLMYTPGGPNTHSQNREEHFVGAILFKNVTFKNLAFYTANTVLTIQNYAAVDGLTFENCYMVATSKTENPRFLFASVTGGTLTDAEGTPVLTASLKNITIRGCTVEEAYQVVELRGTENLTIEGNTFKNIADRVILLAGDVPYTGTLSVKNNTADGLGERFLRATAIEGTVTVTGNTVTNYTGADTDIIKITGTPASCTVEGNTLPDGATVTTP